MFMNKWKNSIIINMVKEIQLWPMWQKFCWRMLFESGHRNCSWKKHWIQLWSLWQKFHQKYFTKGFKSKVQIQNIHEILLEKFFKVHIENVHKRFENTIVMSVAKISHKILNWFNLNLKVHKEIVHDKDFEFNCVHCGKTFTAQHSCTT